MQNLGADLQKKKINYNNHLILKWCLTNIGIETNRNGNIVLVKNQSPKRRIDGTASMLDAYMGLFDNYESFLRTMLNHIGDLATCCTKLVHYVATCNVR